ncbi:MAG TPA: hypothetical protein VLG10_14930 [Methylomirabilota bacterium]|nr:hypothetical protein [Methylomirabilota bacterium]
MTRRSQKGGGRSRRLVINVCPLEAGLVSLSVRSGLRAVPMDARMIRQHLDELIRARGLSDRVRVREACAGGCSGSGPNVSVTIYPAPRAGEPPDGIAIGWRTYVYSLGTLDCLAAVIDDNL